MDFLGPIIAALLNQGISLSIISLVLLAAGSIYWLIKQNSLLRAVIASKDMIILDRDNQLREVHETLLEVTKDFSEAQTNCCRANTDNQLRTYETVTEMATKFSLAIENLLRLTTQNKVG
jgi:hypothetical protein